MDINPSLEELGDRLKEVRLERCISQQNLGRRIGQDADYIARLELGLFDPELSDLFVLIHELDLPLSEFFSDFKGHD